MVFTQDDGSPLHPADVTEHFQHLARQAGLPPIRLHDLRHGAATTALAAGVEMKVVQHMLRHASLTTTSDLYTNVLPELARAAAEATARRIPRAKINTLGLASGPFQPRWTVARIVKTAHKPRNRRSTVMLTCGLVVRRQGLEPRTRWLRASCSAS